MHTRRRLPRRHFLTALAGTAAAFALAPGRMFARSAAERLGPSLPLPAVGSVNNPALDGELTHFAWVWEFNTGGSREQIRELLAAHGLGIVVKTHDGDHWMSEFDASEDAVSGPGQVARLGAFFEAGGVPFHTWYNARGVNPAGEAEMSADVLDAGARSLFIDLEAHAGFWEGTPQGALRIGETLRARHPDAWLSIAIDPRPWEIGRIPLAEFASFANEVAPQVYWDDFRDSANLARFRDEGYDPGGIEGITPRFVLSAAMPRLRKLGLPIHPIGDGSASSSEGWPEFLDEAFALLAESVSVWRVGEIDPGILQLLRDTPPRPMSYIVRPGDALSVLADDWGADLTELMAANGITSADHIRIGQQLTVPFASGRGAHVASWRPGGGVHTIAPGDSLWDLAARWGTTVEEIARVNEIADPGHVWIGQRITVPGATANRGSHTIAPGDNLWSLARRWDSSVEEIVRVNGITDPGSIRIGQRIVIPPATAGSSAGPPAPPPARRSHTIAPGDNLWSLARRWDTTVEEIVRVNSIAEQRLIRTGDTLIIP